MNDSATTAPQEHHVNVTAYLIIFGALLVLTVVTVLVSYWHLPPVWAVFVAMAIATFKASLVAAFFMHLKGERLIIYGLLGVTAFFLLLLYVLPITDNHWISDRTTHTAVVVTDEAR